MPEIRPFPNNLRVVGILVGLFENFVVWIGIFYEVTRWHRLNYIIGETLFDLFLLAGVIFFFLTWERKPVEIKSEEGGEEKVTETPEQTSQRKEKLTDHCFQCGGPADFKTAGDAWCWKCDAAAHYAIGRQSVNDDGVGKMWRPAWLESEYLRLQQELAQMDDANDFLHQEGGRLTQELEKSKSDRDYWFYKDPENQKFVGEGRQRNNVEGDIPEERRNK